MPLGKLPKDNYIVVKYGLIQSFEEIMKTKCLGIFSIK